MKLLSTAEIKATGLKQSSFRGCDGAQMKVVRSGMV